MIRNDLTDRSVGRTGSGSPADGGRADRIDTERRTESEQLTFDETFELLRIERRRAVLRYLRTEPETTTGDLADRIAAEEVSTTPDQLRSGDRKRVYISLYQAHLPKLAEKGVIAYDSDRGDVYRLAAADQLDRRLDRFEVLSARSDGGHFRYAGVTVGLAVVAGAAGIPPLGVVGPAWWAVVGVAALSALSITCRRR